MVVVVAGHDYDLGVRRRLGERGEEGLGQLEYLGERALAQLDDVPQKDQAIRLRRRLEQHVAHGRAAQEVDVGAGAEVKVGDDQGPHAPILAGAEH